MNMRRVIGGVDGLGHSGCRRHRTRTTAVRRASSSNGTRFSRTPFPAPAESSRRASISMVHIAMFDAVNAIERDYSPYRVALRERGRGSPEAAAAQAAHDVLVGLNPGGDGDL